MTVSRLRRCAPVLVVVALAAALSGCSSTMSDAATVEYPYGSGAKTMHVNLNDFEKELGELTGNAEFRKTLQQQQVLLPLWSHYSSLMSPQLTQQLVSSTSAYEPSPHYSYPVAQTMLGMF